MFIHCDKPLQSDLTIYSDQSDLICDASNPSSRCDQKHSEQQHDVYAQKRPVLLRQKLAAMILAAIPYSTCILKSCSQATTGVTNHHASSQLNGGKTSIQSGLKFSFEHEEPRHHTFNNYLGSWTHSCCKGAITLCSTQIHRCGRRKLGRRPDSQR